MNIMNALYGIKKMLFMERTKSLFLCLLIGGYCYTHAADSSQIKPQNNASTAPSTQYAKASNTTAPSTNPSKGNDYLPISFDILGDYDYTEPLYTNGQQISSIKNQIPDKVKSLNGKKVAIQGYFYPVDIENGGIIKDFMILRNQITCCFGCAVRINEWISVTMRDGKSLKADFTSRPVTLYGTLEVGEKFDNGCLMNLYRMKADKMVEDK